MAARTLRMILRIALAVALAVGALPSGARALTLADLLAPGSFVLVGDLAFEHFANYSSVGTNGAPAVSPGDISAAIVSGGVPDLGPGIRWQTPTWSVVAGQTQTTSWTWEVRSLTGAPVIDDFFQAATFNGTGGGNVGAIVTDENGNGVFTSPPVIIHIAGGTEILFVAPQDILHMETRENLIGLTGPLSVTDLTQRFSEIQVAEPGTFLFLGSGLAGLAGLAWRRGRRK